MTRDEAKKMIFDEVTAAQGCKIAELVVRLCDQTEEFSRHLIQMVEEMVADQQLVEVEYVLPSMNYRRKSFLLPGGTTVRVFDGEAPDIDNDMG